MPGSSESVQKFTKVEGRSRGFSARDLSLVASFAALIWVLGVPGAIDPVGSGVPITLQTLGVMLAGAVLGARRGAAASLVVIALCAIGLPVLAGGRGGL
ncbi:biotin transporter BioY, partial [Dermatophilus congolensis]